MSKIVHPYAHRLGILRDWKSRWFAVSKNYLSNLKADVLMREYLTKKLRGFYISSVEIERNQKATRVIIKTSRPGMLIGRSGEGITKLRDEFTTAMKKRGVILPKDLKLDI